MQQQKKANLWKIVWQAGKKDFLLGVPWLPVYSLAEVALALFAGLLLQLIFISNQTTFQLSSVVPGKLKSFIHVDKTFLISDLIYIVPFAIVIISFVKFLSGFMSSYLTERAGHRVAHVLREKMLVGFLSSVGNLLDQKNPDHVANQLMQDTTLLQGAITKGTISAVRDFLVLIGVVVSMLLISWTTFVLGICIVIPLFFTFKFIAKRLSYYTQNSQKKQINISARFLATHHGILTINALHSQKREFEDFQHLNQDNYQFARQGLFVKTFFSPVMEFFAIFGLACLFYWRLSYQGDFQASTYSSMAVLLAFSFRYMKNIANTITFFSDIQVVLQRINDYLNDYTTRLKSFPVSTLVPSDRRAVVAKNISFVTSSGRVILQNCQIEVFKGQKVALIGESGAGKTTFLRILAGLVIPTDGQLSIVKEFLLASQTPYVFKATVKENIQYADTSYTEQIGMDRCRELVLALSLAYSDFGSQIFLDKNLGFLGEGLSGGEKARVSLARVLYANPKLILLDEPTANLDANSAKLFWKAVSQWQSKDPERTVIAVSHAIHEIQDFDFCYVFDSGKITQQGTPKEVLNHA